MVLAIGYQEAKSSRYRSEYPTMGGGVFSTRFFGSRDNPDLPLAQINQLDPGLHSSAHYHTQDQFQVIIDGKGSIGRHRLSPYTIHFTRAYTPYGPLIADSVDGLSFFVLRAHPDTGSQHLPEKRAALDRVTNRRPWQVSCSVVFPECHTETGPGVAITEIEGVKNNDGLAGYAMRMQPGARTNAPDPGRGEGQFVLIVKGSVLHEGAEMTAPALLFVRAQDGAMALHAGSLGLEAIVLNFPVRQAGLPD